MYTDQAGKTKKSLYATTFRGGEASVTISGEHVPAQTVFRSLAWCSSASSTFFTFKPRGGRGERLKEATMLATGVSSVPLVFELRARTLFIVGYICGHVLGRSGSCETSSIDAV